MAKKKVSGLEQLLHAPLSLPLVGVFALIGTSLVSLNISLFLEQPRETATIPTAITQNTLQNVLGSTISIGEHPKTRPLAKEDPRSKYWKEVLSTKPNYPDAYISLAVLSFNSKNCADTRMYMKKAYDLDPDNIKLQEISPHLKPCIEVQP